MWNVCWMWLDSEADPCGMCVRCGRIVRQTHM